ncbi:MAG: exosortase/archaeosortase family protein [Candidatus Sulfotelmatobacter sp.]
MGYFALVWALPPPFRTASKQQLWKAGILLGLLARLYYPIVFRLAEQCWNDPNCSHGFVVPIFSIFVLWHERSRLAILVPHPSVWGAPLLVSSISVLALGVLGAELFLSRASLLLVLASLIVFFLGWQYFRALLFPWAFLILMIPPPAILFNQVTFPLQILASELAAALLRVVGVPVLREGNVIKIPAITLEVAEACSGIRSLLSLVTLAIIYGFLAETRKPIRVALVVAAIPIAVVANGLRIVGAGVLAQYWGPGTAKGFLHAFSGWLIFLLSLALLILLHRFLLLFEHWQEARHDAV